MTPRDAFINETFLLDNEPARSLYAQYARPLPIIDFHSHLVPALIARDHRFANLAELWLAEDRAKWRVMRAHGVDERYCSGPADDYEKFLMWAETLPKLLRSPLYHWSHMELKRVFGISDRCLDARSAPGIWAECNAQLARPEFSARGLMRQARIVLVCTTDDPTDTLEHHRTLAADPSFDIQVLPTWRPDRALAADNPDSFNTWVSALAAAADVDVRDYAAFLTALRQRHAAFHALGCRLSDHGLATLVADGYTERDAAATFRKVRSGTPPDADELGRFKSALLHELALLDHAAGWTQQFHLGALRDCNTRRSAQLGPDMGFDSLGDFEQARPLARFLDRLDRTDQLPRTILYNLNPRDNALFATMIGNFPDSRIPGKLQFGSAWWFNDHQDGIVAQLEALSHVGLLSRFVGMVTDSRSLLSHVRHEYFRRVLCNMLGGDVVRGRLPDDHALLGQLVSDLCYNNAASLLGFNLPQAKPTTDAAEREAAA